MTKSNYLNTYGFLRQTNYFKFVLGGHTLLLGVAVYIIYSLKVKQKETRAG